MKLSCIPICLFNDIIRAKTMSLQSWFEMAVELGLDGIEMYEAYLQSWQLDHLSSLAQQVADLGLEVSMFTSYADLSSSEPAKRQEQILRIRRAIDAATVFKTNIVRATSGSWIAGLSRDEILANVASGLRNCLDYAESKGVMLALEDHPHVGTKIADFMRILELVSDERLKVNLDTSNTLISGESAAGLAELVKERVVHIHASDRRADLSHCVEGEGVVDFIGIFKQLKSVGFNGWVSVEAGGNKGKESIRQGLEYIRRTWERA